MIPAHCGKHTTKIRLIGKELQFIRVNEKVNSLN